MQIGFIMLVCCILQKVVTILEAQRNKLLQAGISWAAERNLYLHIDQMTLSGNPSQEAAVALRMFDSYLGRRNVSTELALKIRAAIDRVNCFLHSIFDSVF